MSLNKAFILGNLGRDPEIKQTSTGKAVCTLNVATESEWKDRDGEKHKATEWHRVIVWDEQGERCARHLSKGSQVLVEGEIRTRRFEADGKQVRLTEIVAQRVDFVGRPAGERRSEPRGEPAQDDPPW